MASFGRKPRVNPFGIHVEEHILKGKRVSRVGEHKTLGICVSPPGKRISLGK